MNKLKNFFFNKIEKNKPTSFSELITSFALGGGKIFILLILVHDNFKKLTKNKFL